jgi:hypothetical protein
MWVTASSFSFSARVFSAWASRSLRWADYAAQRADYAIAVGWVQTPARS